MQCPKCGEPIYQTQHYCSNCGNNLDDKAKLFDQHKKAAKKCFLEECREIIGEHDGCSKLGQAAWLIATNTPDNYAYLQGHQKGSVESYELLKKAVGEARGLAQFFRNFQEAYNDNNVFALIAADNFKMARLYVRGDMDWEI